jgi:hypothetical protein
MIDFVKLVVPGRYTKRLKENQLLNFEGTYSKRTGELSNKLTAEYRNLKFIVYENSNYAEIQGSLHKYYNDGQHNANDFSLLHLQIVIHDLNTKFQLTIESFKISNIEFGVNIEPPIKVKHVLTYLLYHKGVRFRDVFIKDGNYKQAAHQRTYLKIYDKGTQYRGKYNLPTGENLRIELKYVKMLDLRKQGLCCLADLFDPLVLMALETLLTTAWSNTFLFDITINRRALKAYYRRTKYLEWKDVHYWLELSKQNRNAQKKMYESVIENYSEKIQIQIGCLISKKWNELIRNQLPINRQVKIHSVTN